MYMKSGMIEMLLAFISFLSASGLLMLGMYWKSKTKREGEDRTNQQKLNDKLFLGFGQIKEGQGDIKVEIANVNGTVKAMSGQIQRNTEDIKSMKK